MPAKKVKAPAKKVSKKEPVLKIFDPLAELDADLDVIEKKYGLASAMLDKNEPRLSTGLLAIDLILNGGIVSGGWYTTFGGEQSCKSTLTMTLLASIIKQKFVGAASVFDYEGCVTGDTLVTFNGKEQPIIEVLVNNVDLEAYEYDKFHPVTAEAKAVGGIQGCNAVRVRENKPITAIETSSGKKLRGYKHKVMAVNEGGCLEWTYLEDLRVGMKVVQEATAS